MARKLRLVQGELRRRRRKTSVTQKILLGVLAAAVVFCVFSVVRKAIRPILLLCAGRAEVHRMEVQYARDKAENKALKERRKYLHTPAGVEAEARKLGYVRPGEVSVVIEGKKSSK